MGFALVIGLLAWLLRDRVIHAVLRLLTKLHRQSRSRRAVGGALLVVVVVLVVGFLHWAHKLQALP